MVKYPPANAGHLRDVSSIPGSGRSPGGGHSNPLQYCLENPMDRGACWATVLSDSANSTQDVQGQGKCPDLLGVRCWQQRGLIWLGGVTRAMEQTRSSLHLKAGRPAGWEARSIEQGSALTLVPGLASLGGIPGEDEPSREGSIAQLFLTGHWLLTAAFLLLLIPCFEKSLLGTGGKSLKRGEEVK